MGCGWITVREATVRPLLTCGKFSGIARSGCNCTWCCTNGGDELDLSLHQLPVTVGTRTKDNVWVTIDVVVHWRVILGAQDIHETSEKILVSEHHDDLEKNRENLKALTSDDLLYRACFYVDSPAQQISSHTEEYFRISVAQYAMDKLLELGNSITAGCTNVLNGVMNEYGYCIQKVVINGILPENRVRGAMNDIVASEKERFALITRADAEKARRIKAAEADSEVNRLHGEGLASQRFAIVEGLKTNVEEFALATHENHESVMALLLMSQYTDTLKESIAANRNVSLILSASPGVGALSQEDAMRNALLTSFPQPGTSTNNNQQRNQQQTHQPSHHQPSGSGKPRTNAVKLF